MAFLKLMNFCPCSGLLMKSPQTFSVGQYSIVTFPFFTWSVIKKYRIFNARLCLPALPWPFLSYRMELLLSWCKMVFSTGWPCASTNNFIHRICVAPSLTPISLASVRLQPFSFGLSDRICIPPSPIVITLPIWLQKSGWTANDASMYHLIVRKSFALNIKCNSWVPFRYLINLMSFFQSSSLGFHTLVASTEIVGAMSNLAFLLTNNPFATKLWKISSFLYVIFLLFQCPNDCLLQV